jgi:hypothetical protein
MTIQEINKRVQFSLQAIANNERVGYFAKRIAQRKQELIKLKTEV